MVIQASIHAELFLRPKIIHTEPFVNTVISHFYFYVLLDKKKTELEIMTTKIVDEIIDTKLLNKLLSDATNGNLQLDYP